MKRIAICFSGHDRNFINSFEKIKTNFILPLEENNCKIDYFLSLWDTNGHRKDNWGGYTDINSIIQLLNPKGVLIEQFDRNNFIYKYNTDKWKEYSHLSNNTTCGDSVSMWYKVQGCFDMVEKYQTRYNFEYDSIVRTRPDVLFNDIFNTAILNDIFSNDVVYIPRWHGKYEEISKTVMDFFGIGNYKVMKQYMSVYNNVEYLLECNEYPHTGEGLLCGQLQNIEIKRIDNGFSLQRNNYVEIVV